MNTTAGCGAEPRPTPPQANAGKVESGGGDDEMLGAGLVTGPGPCAGVWRLRGFDTNRTPITTAAMTAAANPAIQKGPRCSGAISIDDRTRSGSAAEGDPVISSNT